MKYIVIVKADTNDADYVENSCEILKEDIEDLYLIAKAIENCKGRHNWETDDHSYECTPEKLYVDTGILTEEQVDWFNEYFTPYSEYGIHTIESITLLEVVKETQLL